MSDCYKLSGGHCKVFPARMKFNFPLTGADVDALKCFILFSQGLPGRPDRRRVLRDVGSECQ